MKKNILIVCAVLAAFSLMAFGIINWNAKTTNTKSSCNMAVASANTFDIYGLNTINTSELFYNIDSRFIWNITREKLLNSNSIYDILPAKAVQNGSDFRNVKISLLHEDGEVTILGENEFLNADQKKLLESVDYSTNFFVGADYTREIDLLGNSGTGQLTYYFSVIPEKEAQFGSGHESLIDYLKTQSTEKTGAIEENKLQPCRVNFVVSKEGKVKDVTLDATSGYPDVDEAMVELITNLPEKWEPAQNEKGEKVDQKLIFFFGKAGC